MFFRDHRSAGRRHIRSAAAVDPLISLRMDGTLRIHARNVGIVWAWSRVKKARVRAGDTITMRLATQPNFLVIVADDLGRSLGEGTTDSRLLGHLAVRRRDRDACAPAACGRGHDPYAIPHCLSMLSDAIHASLGNRQPYCWPRTNVPLPQCHLTLGRNSWDRLRGSLGTKGS